MDSNTCSNPAPVRPDDGSPSQRKRPDTPVRSRVGRYILAGFLCLLLVVIASQAFIHVKTRYFINAVLPGRLYRSSEMTPERLARLAAELGIASVIDLRHPEWDDAKIQKGTTRKKIEQSRHALESAGIRHVSLPSGQLPDDGMIRRFLTAIEVPDAHPILIHCDHGIGRAGLYTAVYLMEYAGFSNEKARHTAAYYYTPRLTGRKHFRPGYNKGQWIMSYVPGKRHSNPPE